MLEFSLGGSMQEWFVVLTIVSVGLMVGVEFSVAVFVNPIFNRLANNAGLEARSDGARVLGQIMPFWYMASLLLSTVWTLQAWGRPQVLMIAMATALLVVSVVMSITLLVPINALVARWSTEGAPANWRELAGRWERFHYVRVGLIVAAFALLVWVGVT
jgi:uncharacterized membrane protein